MIHKVGDKFIIKSQRGKTLGSYASKEAAVERLRQIEYFKTQKRAGVAR